MAAVPLGKLMSLAIRTIAKPISRILKSQAQQHPSFRTKVMAPIGQGVHWMSVRMKRFSLNSTRRDVTPLEEAVAVETGAEVVGEAFIFSVAAALLIWDYNSSAQKSAAKEEMLQQTLQGLRTDLDQTRRDVCVLGEALDRRLSRLEKAVAQAQQQQQDSHTKSSA